MARPDPAFEERLNKEYDLRGRAKLAIIISMIMYSFFLLLDWIYTPQFFRLFLLIRAVVVVLNAALLILFAFTKTNRGYARLGMAMVIFDAIGIAIMIQVMGGFYTSYYQGLNIIVMGMVVVIPLTFRESLFLYALTWASYAIPSFSNLGGGVNNPPGIPPGSEWRFITNNLFFLTSIIVVGAFGSYLMDSIRRRELRSRIQLEETSEKLQESNVKLKTLDELKTQFFANVNHELRTPLTLMLAPLGPIMEGRMGRITASQRETLDTIRRNGFKLLKLINNLLDLTKLEAGKMRLKIKTVDITDFIASLLSSVKPMADQRELKLYFQHPPYDLDICVDPDQFEKVVLNLLSNALKFTPPRGKITVYIEDKERLVTLTVEDTGPGIPSDMLESIFNRFSQVDGSMSRRHEGTGIGLSLAREIVLIHGGGIRAESEVGKGSRFIVDIPKGDEHYGSDILDRRFEDKPVELKKRESDSEGLRVQDIVADFRSFQLIDLEKVEVGEGEGEKVKSHDYLVLVIDDNPEVLKLMKILLGDEYDLDLSISAEEGLAKLRERTPDLVLCDVMMPGMDGHAFCRKVKEDPALKHTPVILVTARTGAAMVAEGVEAGADDYIAKPFDSVELKARIRSLLRMRRVEAELSLLNRNLRMRTSDLVEQQRNLFLSMVKSLVSAIDAKDAYTRHHSTRVTDFSLKIASKMDLSEREIRDLELACLLHDVGKIAVPGSILNKPGKLTDQEFALIKEHPIRGENILKPVIELQQIARVVRAHHEHYDGSGYPDGIKGREIPIGARIMAVADAYDSITSERPYRRPASHNYAVKEIIRNSGIQFDPEVVEVFLETAGLIASEKKGEETSNRM